MSSTAIVVNRLLERLKFITRLLNREPPEHVAMDLKADWGKVESLARKIDTVLNNQNTNRQSLRLLVEEFRVLLVEERRKHNNPIADAIINQKLIPLINSRTEHEIQDAKRAIDLDGRLLVEIDKAIREAGEIYIVRFFGPIEEETAERIQGLARTMFTLKIYRVVINMRRATSMNLKGLLPILQYKDRCESVGGGMAFVQVPPPYSAFVEII